MKKVKAFDLDNKWLLIAGSVAILVVLFLWGALANLYTQPLHGAPLTKVSPLSGLVPVDGPRFVHPSEPVQKVRMLEDIFQPVKFDSKRKKKDSAVKTVEGIKEIEIIKSTKTRSR